MGLRAIPGLQCRDYPRPIVFVRAPGEGHFDRAEQRANVTPVGRLANKEGELLPEKGDRVSRTIAGGRLARPQRLYVQLARQPAAPPKEEIVNVAQREPSGGRDAYSAIPLDSDLDRPPPLTAPPQLVLDASVAEEEGAARVGQGYGRRSGFSAAS